MSKLNFYTPRQYQSLADLYGLGKIEKLSYLHRGYQSPKVAVETPRGKFVISKNRLSDKKDIISKSVASLQYEIDMLQVMKGLPVPKFHVSRRGNFIEKLGTAWVTVYDFMEGSFPKKFSPKMAHSLGAFLGAFHRRGNKFKKNLASRRRFYDLSPAVVRKMMVYARQQKNPILKAAVDEVRAGVEANRPSRRFPVGPIHVDIKDENELFAGDRLSAVIDFGNFYRGPYMIDVGKTIMWNFCLGDKLDRRLTEYFLKGYESRRKLSREERAYLNRSILYAIYSHTFVDLYHVPLGYVPESYTLYLVKHFLPIARQIDKI